jgi:thiol:disulfide interchange protein DsbA
MMCRCSAAQRFIVNSLHLTGEGKKNKGSRKGEMNMKRQNASIRAVLIIVMLLVLPVSGLCAEKQPPPFPEYGTGAVQVRIYTDYFCPPCRAMEPAVEPVLKDLLKRNAIRLTLVDTPFYRHSALYAKFFLYALKKKNHIENAFHIRNVLIAATADRQMITEARLKELFDFNKIPYEAFEIRPVLDRYNSLIKEDKINATPTCVIVRNGKKEIFIGATDTVAALKRLP